MSAASSLAIPVALDNAGVLQATTVDEDMTKITIVSGCRWCGVVRRGTACISVTAIVMVRCKVRGRRYRDGQVGSWADGQMDR